MISVEKAITQILSFSQNYGQEKIPILKSAGRVLMEQIEADRDFPPFDRVSYDGIAVRYEDYVAGQRSFPIVGVQGAGAPPLTIDTPNSCIEIMTGAIMPTTFDTIIPYEWLDIKNQQASVIREGTQPGRHIHPKGYDQKKGDILLPNGTILQAQSIGLLASIGKSQVTVKKNPSIAVLSTGDELVGVDETPLPYQIRRSNIYMIRSTLAKIGIESEDFHVLDSKEVLVPQLQKLAATYDILIISGGVSKGKYDYIPDVLESIGINKQFHHVKQRPGKPMWFGTSEKTIIFGLPGNPVSSAIAMVRYVIPWLKTSLGIPLTEKKAILSESFHIKKSYKYFLSVKIHIENGQLFASPQYGHGSGDLANLALIDGFLELPYGPGTASKGTEFPYYPLQ